MKKLVLKNSFFVAVLALLAFFIIMPSQSNAYASANAINGSLDGYVYSFDIDSYSPVVDVVTANAFTTVDVANGAELNEEVADITISEAGHVTIDFTAVCEKFYGEGATIVTCYINHNRSVGEGYDAYDAIVFNKIAVTEEVATPASADTTFEYGVDSVMTINADLTDEELAALATKDQTYQTALEYLRDKTDLIAANAALDDEGTNPVFVWVNNKIVLSQGATKASGSVVLAVMASRLVQKTGLTTGATSEEAIDLSKITDPATIQAIVRSIPLAINIKETNVSTSQYSVSDQQYGLLLTPIADYFAGNTDSLTTILTTFFPYASDGDFSKSDLASGLDLVWNYLAKKGIYDNSGDQIVNISKCFTLLSFNGYKNPQEFVDSFNAMFNGLISQFIADTNAAFANNALIQELISAKGFKDQAAAIAYIFDTRAPLSRHTEYKAVKDAFVAFAKGYAVKATAYIDAFAADSATKLAVVDEMEFYHGINTGDSNNFVAWAVMFVMAILGLAGAALKRN